MNDRRAFLLTAGSAAMTLATLGWKSPVLAQTASPVLVRKTTSLLLPLTGVFFYPPDPCIANGESVALTGDMHVVTHVYPAEPVLVPPTPIRVNIHLNTAGAQGTGQSGTLYLVTGSPKFIGVAWPPQPDLQANFALEPTDGCASVPLPLNFELVFASDGTLLPQSSVYPPEPM
jgi:hypothetical protein